MVEQQRHYYRKPLRRRRSPDSNRKYHIEGYPRTGWSEYYEEAVERALDNGLDPNTLWNEDMFVDGGIVRAEVNIGGAWAYYNTPLQHALHKSCLEAAGLLLRRQAQIDQYNSMGRTALHEATWNMRYDVVQFLLEHNADPNKPTTMGTQVTSGNKEMIRRSGELCIHYALYRSDLKLLRMLLAAGAHIRDDPWTALDLAIWAGDTRATTVLLEFDPTLLDQSLAHGADLREADLVQQSRALLEAADSTIMIPPSEFYAAYCSSLREAASLIEPGSGVSRLIDAFSKLLRRAAGLEPQPGNKSLCEPCERFLGEAQERWDLPPGNWNVPPGEKGVFDFTLYNDRQALEQSALTQGCPFCCIVADTLDYAASDDKDTYIDGKESSSQQHPSRPIILHCINSTNANGKPTFWVTWGARLAYLWTRSSNEQWAQQLRKLQGSDRHTGSDNAMRIAKHWLESCTRESHHACFETYDKSRKDVSLPKRLIHVGTKDGQSPRLVETKDMVTSYCALSYCWGPGGFMTTTKANLSQMMKGIAMDDLPLLLRHAITVAQTLGFQYIWIDALCIVQNDADDWAGEAARMHIVYSNADLTISTKTTSTCHGSLFQDRKFRSSHAVPLDWWLPRGHRSPEKQVQILEPIWPPLDDPSSPVDTRAWTLQEQQMSTRMLWFGHGTISWDCLQGPRAEAEPHRPGDGRSLIKVPQHLPSKVAFRGVATQTTSTWQDRMYNATPFRLWRNLLEEFTRRNIKHESDRLPAFSAITHTLTARAGCQSAHGVWLGEKMIPSLCWKLMRPSRSAKLTDMPSWLWAGVGSEIAFGLVEKSEEDDEDATACASSVSFDTRTDASLSRVSGSITIKGTLLKKKSLSSEFVHVEDMKRHRPGWLGNRLFLDHDAESFDECYAVPLLRYPEHIRSNYALTGGRFRGTPPRTVVLIIQKVSEKDDIFRRIGIAVQFENTNAMGVQSKAPQPAGFKTSEDDGDWFEHHEAIYESRLMTLV